MAKPVPLRVMLLEDDESTRLILTEIFASDNDFALVGTFVSCSAGLAWLDTHAPDVLVADLHLKDGLSFDVIRKCSQRYPNCSIMVLTSSDDKAHIDVCIEAGATGYLLKEDGYLDLGRAIKEMVHGGSPMSPSIIRHILCTARSAIKFLKKECTDSSENFTPREVEVLRLLEQGHTYDGCADKLGISVLTLQNYIKRVYRKLAVNTKGQAVFEAKRRGVL